MRWHALMSFVASMRYSKQKMRTPPSLFFGPALSSPCCSSASSRFHSWAGSVKSRASFLFSYSVTTEARHNPCQLVLLSIRLSTPQGSPKRTSNFVCTVIHSKCWGSQYRHRIQGSIHRRFWQCQDSSDMLEHPGALGATMSADHAMEHAIPSHPETCHWLLQGVC